MEWKEQHLIRKAQKGDADAFVALMQQYETALYKVAKSYLGMEEDVADALQETILSAWEHLPHLREISYCKTWMTRICINQCKDILRQRNRTIPEGYEITEQAPPSEQGFYELLEALPPEDRTIFLLYYGQGFRTREIAELLEMKESTVKSRLLRGRQRLAAEYGTEGEKRTWRTPNAN